MVKSKGEVSVSPNGDVNISVTIRNNGQVARSFVVGLSIENPDEDIIDLPPKDTGLVSPGDEATVSWSKLTEGCLSSRTGGPEIVDLFKSKGEHNILTRVYQSTQPDTQECYGTSLVNPVTELITLEDAIKVEEGGGKTDIPLSAKVLAGVSAAGVAGYLLTR